MKKPLLQKSLFILLFATTLIANAQTVSFYTWPNQSPFCGSSSCTEFINNSTDWDNQNTSVSWLWNFDGDTTTYSSGLWVCFDTLGTFPVSLTEINGEDSITTVQYLTILPFAFPYITQSYDTLFCNVDSSYVSYIWYDSTYNTSTTTTNSYFVINHIGEYVVTVTSDNGCNAFNAIIATCGAAFTLAADTAQMHHYIATNLAIGYSPINYDWNWGDGTPDDTIPYPSHTYADSGFYNICLSITDSKGCQSTYCDNGFNAMRTTNTMVYVNVVNPTLVTGTQAVNMQTPQVTISPNPATDELLIDGNWKETGNWEITIVNTLGQTIYTEELNSKQSTINCKSFPSGIYFLEMQNETGRWVGRFVKE